MISPITVLFDLDDTLLTDDMENTFIPAYLTRLRAHFSEQIPPEILGARLSAAIQMMLKQDSPETTLEQTFDHHFYPSLGLPKTDIQITINDFYENEYPKLSSLTQERPEAIQLIQDIGNDNHQIVIATNPLFPRTATMQRISWANLPIETASIPLISTFEDFHFAKPNPAYYAEVLAQLGWPTAPAVMIGNDWENDIQAASRLGIPTYWVTDHPDDLPEETHPLSDQGSLSDVLPWLDNLEKANYQPSYDSIEAIIAILKSTPAAISTLCSNLVDEHWNRPAGNQEWSIVEIICHMLDVDVEINLPRVDHVAQQDNPFIPGMDADSWANKRNYILRDGPSALQSLIDARIQLLNALSRLSPEDWLRPARHAIFGPTTLRELIGFIATHDQNHMHQLFETIQRFTHTA